MLAAVLLVVVLQVWQKDAVKLTMRERLAAKARKEDMLAHSITSSISAAVVAAAACDSAEPGRAKQHPNPIQ
jgi:hypothetical protein